MTLGYDYERRRTSSVESELTAYAARAFQLFREESAGERAISVARTVGRQAARLGFDETSLSRWLQSAYGTVWVRLSGLNPGADLKEVKRHLLIGFRTPSRKASEDAASFAREFFQREPSLSRYAPRAVVDKSGGDAGHPEARQHGDQIWLFPKFWRLDAKTRDYVFTHELGHYALSRVGLSKLVQHAPECGVDPWDSDQLPFGQSNMEEAFADSFASAYWSPGELRSRYPGWGKLVKALT